MSDNTRIWIYQADRKFTDHVQEIKSELDQFLTGWNSHGEKVSGSYILKYDVFIILTAEQNVSNVSGCSVDSSVSVIRSLGSKFNIDFMNRDLVYFLNEGSELKCVPLARVQVALDDGVINENSIVFNNSLSRKDDFESSWEKPLRQSWLVNFLN